MDAEKTIPCIVPLADMLNHPTFDTENFNWTDYHYDQEAKSFKVIVNSDYEPGDQVWTTYGLKTSTEFLEEYLYQKKSMRLLLIYGMICVNNSYDELLYNIDQEFLDGITDRNQKEDFLKDHQLPIKSFKIRKGELPHELIKVIQVYLWNSSTNYADAWTSEESYYTTVLEMLKKEEKRRSSKEDDEQLLADDDLSYHASLAVWYRKNQKRMLRALVRLLNAKV